jgi:hypothetical protein
MGLFPYFVEDSVHFPRLYYQILGVVMTWLKELCFIANSFMVIFVAEANIPTVPSGLPLPLL